ncbi:ArsC family transcriptional regulator [Alkalicaulis satelles]|uniref:ArsC family transcriptional regulator n=1 Tax=Alkalicaulis satelles TaxID=2609175 RepID=A0A5M6ZC96_9PROT|nr:ArsC/Spx/MgsR family protein [Alkalicaulis satelles]KAA5802366.1 ArsC family transcriptional regulator [Alkalicaulis satelles]
MTGATLYGLKSCDTCRKALKALDAAGIAATFTDVRSDPGLAARLPGWLEALGAEALANTRSTTWRGLDERERARLASDPAGLLADHPALIKRPVIEAGGAVHCGWTPAARAALGLG